MHRRAFLIGTAALGAGASARALPGQAPPQAPAANQGQAGPGRGRGGQPANVPASKLARISFMTLNFSGGGILKFPWTTNPTPMQTVDILDLPKYYVDHYGVTHIEYQHNHLVQGNATPPDAAFFRELRARQDAVKVTATQINIEIGELTTNTPEGTRVALTGEARTRWIALGKQWVDAAPILGVTRLMLNQTGLNQDNKAGVISVWKEIQDYARPKGIMISAEGRGAGGARGATPPAAAPAPAPSWMLLAEVVEAAGGYSNVDIGNAGAANQQALHDAIKGLFKTSSGNMHIKSSPNWDIGQAVRFTESLGYKGFYSIEVNGEPAMRIVYNTILANLS